MPPPARRGRPRDAGADAQILRAAEEELLANGYAAFAVDKVARSAGVAKTTLYRRWPTKDHLAIAVIARMQDEVPVPDTGDLRADLVDYLEQIALGLDRTRRAGPGHAPDDPSSGLVGELVAAAARHPDIGALVRAVFEQRNALVLGLIDRARRRGGLRPDTDPELLFDQLAGALYYRLLITGRPIGRAYAEHLVDAALSGVLPAKEKRT
ncbi:TetR/AcrR family transcriptional regulator [Actinomadura bangladeshensis]|uniref:TetR/AcrR family transcriptional regulator n=1 Tax=Actinomadura bangladeshensis TaxID=453573 RepID=A0A4R4N028_9ACTN|nr:TetR/AcrR family transcriptional regulator [Actinomadura bangladeshensis]TDC01104.1 TetR/AcrR family transcriptional regulator [Actinomadura bangladeshensis]